MVSSLFVKALMASLPLLVSLTTAAPLERRGNNFNCRSIVHPNPVVLLHGLTANQYDDLYALELYLTGLGFCTFSLTYGEYPQFPLVGGLKPITQSAPEISAFIKDVKTRTGAAKIDLVGHSEGGFQVLYVPKFESGISAIVDKIVSIAPPTKGTNLNGLYDLTFIGGGVTNEIIKQALNTVGCGACNDLVPTGDPVKRLNTGPIVQPGNRVTVIYSSADKTVTPPETASPVRENGVRNILVQTQCPNDPVGHVGLAFDTYVWGLVANTLDSRIPLRACTVGLPT